MTSQPLPNMDQAPLLNPLSADEAEALADARIVGGVRLARLLAVNLAKGWIIAERTELGWAWRMTQQGFEAYACGKEVLP